MRLTGPVKAGLLLAGLALLPSIARGRAIESELNSALTTRGSECLVDDASCVGKRAFPKFGDDGDGLGAGASEGGEGSASGGVPAEVGGTAGSTEGVGSGSTAEVGGTGGADQGAADEDTGDVDAGPAPPDPFADPAPGAALPAGRVPGQNVLPRGIPDYVGLEASSAGRTAYQRFLNYDLQGSRLAPPGARYLFWLEDDARDVRAQFKNEFNNQGLHRELLGPGDQGPLVDVTDIYTITGIAESEWQVPAGTEEWFLGAEVSLGTAQRAAQAGGTAHVLGPSLKMDSNVLDRNTLVNSGSTFFNKYELWMLSNGGGTSKIDRILAHNAGNINQPPVPIWTSGQAPLGENPEFVVGTKAEGDDGRLIDLGDF